ncbi:MAG: TIGR01777 family protein [Chloroflexi bacterium]|nr:TIGR01777 family protein [Chloroflexota bacterium]
MHVLITGGTGLIGRAVVDCLLRRDHRVTVLSRRPDRHAHRMPSGVHLQQWDGRSVGEWRDLLPEVDAIINLAGENIAAGRWTERRKQAIRESRVLAGRALVEGLRQTGARPQVLIQASAVGYYGPRGDEIVTEETPPGRDFLARVAVEWEASTAAVEEWGIRRSIIRTGVVLSREGGALPRMLLPFKLGLGGPLGNGRQWFPWIHIADEVGAICFLLEEEEAHGPYNLTAPHPVRNETFTRVLGQVLHRPTFFRVPAWALRLLFGEMATILLEGQRAIPKRLEEAGYTFRFSHVENALSDLLGG